ncbi:MAG TPA: hypothetical protein VKM55_13015 [Candidatus Lokiarchaeia archaeon]|nr:hypothetical protein [Candidatus Lokiarchaeia archaeon]
MEPVLNIVLSGVAAGLLFSGFLIIFKIYIKRKYRSSLYMAIAWFCFMLEAALTSMMYGAPIESTYYLILLKLDNLCLIPAFLSIIAFLESLTRDSVETKSFAVLIFVLGTDSILVIIEPDVSLGSPPWIIVVGIGMLITIAFIIYCVRLYRCVPLNLKRAALWIIIGQSFVSLLFIILNVVNAITANAIGEIDRVFEGIGALILSIMFARQEQLFFVLPFKTQRLIVFGTRNGTSLFAHSWSKSDELINEDLLSGMLQGMSMLFNESLKKGNLREIKMDEGIMIVKHDATYPVAFVLITSRSSSVLREGLSEFANKFIEVFGSHLEQSENVEQFQDASRLVHTCLSFIPQYD